MVSFWQADGNGVMLYKPPGTPTDETRRALSRLSVSQEPAEANRQGQSDKEERSSSRLTSPHTLVEGSMNILLNLARSDASSRPTATRWEEVFEEQVKAYAAEALSSSESSPGPGGTSSTDTSYDSECSSSLPSQETPCPRRAAGAHRRRAKNTSRYFQSTTNNTNTIAPIRPINLGKSTSKVNRKRNSIAKTNNEQSLQQLRVIESSPKHTWTSNERELLCVLWRFFERQPDDFARIFNSMTRLDLSVRRITTQFENHIRLFGPKAFPCFERVFVTPLSDPKGKYAPMRQLIQRTAVELGIDLKPKNNDTVMASGEAAVARSAKTRRLFKTLVRHAHLDSQRQGYQMSQPASAKAPLRFSGVIVEAGQGMNSTELLVDATEAPPTTVKENAISCQPSTETPHLAFRVWDDNSRTEFTGKRGFVADLFKLWNGPLPPPFTFQNQGQRALLILSNSHLSKTGNASAFVSVSTSLLQVMNYASSMKDPRIACIDLGHPTLNEPHKRLEASDVLSWLKRNGQAGWAKYKGHTEIIFWGDIPRAACIATFPLCDLEALSLGSPSCARLLSLDAFQPGMRARWLSAQLHEQNLILDSDIAEAMAHVAKMFSLDGPSITKEHIRCFVARLIDGFVIQGAPIDDVDTMGVYASRFAIALGSRNPRNGFQTVIAFIEGVRIGTATIARYAPRTSSVRRRKTT